MGVTNTPAPGVPRPRPRGWGGGGGRARPPRFAFRFRILIIGRANAGKTTILKKVCQSIVDPEIFTPSGEKLDLSAVDPTAERGLHDIENELIFKSNSRFIFHDSPGFESGSVAEMEKVKLFVKQRAETNKLSDQLHAIWYCLPTDTDRPLLDADTDFFNVRGSGKVPVVAIFTKFDGLVTKAFGKLRNNGMSLIDARKRKFELAHEKLNTDFIVPLMSTAFHPSDHVRLNDMRQDSSHCKELIAKTVDVLDEPRLKLLLVSVQQNNIDLSIRYAVQDALEIHNRRRVRNTVQEGLEWFPHTWRNIEYETPINTRPTPAASFQKILDKNIDFCTKTLRTHFSRLHESIQSDIGLAKLLAELCICAEQTFTEASAMGQEFGFAFSTALNAYINSTHKETVDKEIGAWIQKREGDDSETLVHIIKSHRLRIKNKTPGVSNQGR